MGFKFSMSVSGHRNIYKNSLKKIKEQLRHEMKVFAKSVGYENIEYLGCVDTDIIIGSVSDNSVISCNQYWDNPSDCDLQDSVSITAK